MNMNDVVPALTCGACAEIAVSVSAVRQSFRSVRETLAYLA